MQFLSLLMLILKKKITLKKKPKIYYDPNVDNGEILELLLLHKGYHVKEVKAENGMKLKRFVRGRKYVLIGSKA